MCVLSLEEENRRLKAELEAGIKQRKARLADVKSDATAPFPTASLSNEEKAATALEAASLVSGANLALRATIVATAGNQKSILLDASKLNKSEKAEVDWVVKSTDATYEFALNR